MSDIAIKVQNLSKMYHIRHEERHRSIREMLTHKWSSLIHPSQKTKAVEDFWALRDVSFEIKKGECVGIIGRNGAGKSTLLKILSRITEPTTGRVELHGRVTSLLEVGTGFHQELTGRENIYLNGTILGMTKKEIDRKFDAIVAFAEIEKFLDTVVKRYSSGMYVRLAFAVAAHLECEILIVDEVLAVGDAQFQKKCLGKMGDVSQKEGKTVLFVSHNMVAVKKLCKRGMLLESGIKKSEDEISKVVDAYENNVLTVQTFNPFKIKEIDMVVQKITVNEDTDGVVVPFKPLKIDIEIEAERDINQIGIEIMLSHEDTRGVVFRANTQTIKNMDIRIKKGKNKVSCLIGDLSLCSGRYTLGFGVSLFMVKYYHYEEALLGFDVQETVIEQSCLPTAANYSHVYLDHKWMIEN